MSDKIKEALLKLDVGNDNHWTQDGLAKLDTVKLFNGGTAVTREELDKSFEGFNRSTASAFFMSTGEPGHAKPTDPANSGLDITDTKVPGDPAAVGEDRGNPTGVDADGAPSAQVAEVSPETPKQSPKDEDGHPTGIDAEGKPSAVITPEGAASTAPFNPERSEPVRAPGTSGLAAAAELTSSPRADGAGGAPQAVQPGDGEPTAAEQRAADEAEQQAVAERVAGSDEVEDLEEELEEVEDALTDLTRHLDGLTKEKDKFNAHADRLRSRIAQLKGTSDAGTIQAYLESRKQTLNLRAENKQTLKDSGLKLKDIIKAVSGAPIDQAMARKTARGGRRPSRV